MGRWFVSKKREIWQVLCPYFLRLFELHLKVFPVGILKLQKQFIKIHSTTSEALIIHSYPVIVYNSKFSSVLQS